MEMNVHFKIKIQLLRSNKANTQLPIKDIDFIILARKHVRTWILN